MPTFDLSTRTAEPMRASRLPRAGDRRSPSTLRRRPLPPPSPAAPLPERVAGSPRARKEGGGGSFPPRVGGAGRARPPQATGAARRRGPPSAPPGGGPAGSDIATAGYGVPRRSVCLWRSDGCRSGGSDGGP
jgi:hypothetical protein